MHKNFIFRPGLTVEGYIDPAVTPTQRVAVSLENIRVVGVNHRELIMAADHNGVTYYNGVTPLMATFYFPESIDRDKFLVQDRFWSIKPLFAL